MEVNSNFKIAISFHSSIFGRNLKNGMEWKEIATTHSFACEILLIKKLEIEKTMTTFIISVLKVEYVLGGLTFFNFELH